MPRLGDVLKSGSCAAIWQTRLDVRAAIFEYIEVFYNRQRSHSTLGYKTPLETETQYAAAQAA